MFCESYTNLPMACDKCWFDIADANVSTKVVFGFEEGSTDDYETLNLLKEWTGTGELNS